MLNVVFDWSKENGIHLNVDKCGHVSQRVTVKPLYLGGEEVKLVNSYNYLGFPVGGYGIDFAAHLKDRFTLAVRRSDWLSLYSDSWGAAHRLRVYKQYLSPMFEYGAPLVWAWANENAENEASFFKASRAFPTLLAWIGHYSAARHHVTANLCGLTSISGRFRHLRTAYQLVLDQAPVDNPLKEYSTVYLCLPP